MMKEIDHFFKPDSYQAKNFWTTNKIVAQRFGIEPATIRQHKKNHSELKEGVDYIYSMMKVGDRDRKVLLWSQIGINKLSHIIRTEQAQEHRELTTIDPNRLLQRLESILIEELKPIPQLMEDVKELKEEMVHPVTHSKLLRQLSDKRYEVKVKLNINWHEIHYVAKSWTGLSKYEHMNLAQIKESLRRLDELLESYDKEE